MDLTKLDLRAYVDYRVEKSAFRLFEENRGSKILIEDC